MRDEGFGHEGWDGDGGAAVDLRPPSEPGRDAFGEAAPPLDDGAHRPAVPGPEPGLPDEFSPDGPDRAYPLPDGYVQTVDTAWGAPEDDALYWLFQGYGTGTCGPTSVAMLLADLTGVPFSSNQQVVDEAVALGLIEYDPDNPQWQKWGGWSGMTTSGIEGLLEHYGVGATVYSGAGVEHLAGYLEAGHSIVLMVDGEEVWYGGDDDLTDGGQAPNHFVQVTGVDYVQGVVYLNDPAVEHGAGLAVPMGLFEDAWADAGNAMIMTDRPLENPAPVGPGAVVGQPDTTTASAGLPEPDGYGTILLALTVHALGGTWIVPEETRP